MSASIGNPSWHLFGNRPRLITAANIRLGRTDIDDHVQLLLVSLRPCDITTVVVPGLWHVNGWRSTANTETDLRTLHPLHWWPRHPFASLVIASNFIGMKRP
jgi:hypothetical protein